MSSTELYTYLDKQYGFVTVMDYNIKMLNSKFNVLLPSDVYLFAYIMLEIKLIHIIYQYNILLSMYYLLHNTNYIY